MKALANSRRSRYAPAVLLLLALILTGALYAVLAPKPATATTGGNAQDVETGKALFEANCSTCHGLDAEGTDVAPSLIGVGAASVDFQMATGRMPMANNSPQAEAKPAQFDAEQISQVAAYVASLGPGPAVPSAEQVDPAGGDAANGLALFRTNCAMCHNAVGAGGALTEGKYAPSLYDSTPTEIYEAMLTGPQSMPVFNEANIDPQGKQDIIAFLMEQRETSVGGITLGSLGPVAEGLWVWIIGIGGLIAAAVWIGAKSS
ncbi:c-type cytochrome [Georgenia sp. SUBG003]|uniref:cytochrome bc1 complex diheme cytochrome c subunit n=1 Tax=Georgenia sp. SUBG003 TaxID=1497974 RepID=UPI0004D87EBF|nr:cystathionine beta-lyase [Georgenia sp. SUBG003]